MNLFVHFGIEYRRSYPLCIHPLKEVQPFTCFCFLYTAVFCIISDLPFVCPTQPRTSQCPRSLWQSSTLLWDEACSHSTGRENDESRREGKSAGLQRWEQTRVADNCWRMLIILLFRPWKEPLVGTPPCWCAQHLSFHMESWIQWRKFPRWGKSCCVGFLVFFYASNLHTHFYLISVFFSWLFATTSHCTWMPVWEASSSLLWTRPVTPWLPLTSG